MRFVRFLCNFQQSTDALVTERSKLASVLSIIYERANTSLQAYLASTDVSAIGAVIASYNSYGEPVAELIDQLRYRQSCLQAAVVLEGE
eukprot:SAG31_NODE_28832_length_404_cov_1.350820_1_plen_88_part_10